MNDNLRTCAFGLDSPLLTSDEGGGAESACPVTNFTECLLNNLLNIYK
jgi:hypothetical protein